MVVLVIFSILLCELCTVKHNHFERIKRKHSINKYLNNWILYIMKVLNIIQYFF